MLLPFLPSGPNPLTYFLGSLTACTQYTLGMIVKEKKLPDIKAALWSAEGKYDLRGVQGTGDTDARYANHIAALLHYSLFFLVS